MKSLILVMGLLFPCSEAFSDQNLTIDTSSEQAPPIPIIKVLKSDSEAARLAADTLENKIVLTQGEIAAEKSKLSTEKGKTRDEVRRLDQLQGQLKIQTAKLKKIQRSLNSQKNENHNLNLKIAAIKTKLAKFSAEQNKLLTAKSSKKARSVASEKAN